MHNTPSQIHFYPSNPGHIQGNIIVDSEDETGYWEHHEQQMQFYDQVDRVQEEEEELRMAEQRLDDLSSEIELVSFQHTPVKARLQ